MDDISRRSALKAWVAERYQGKRIPLSGEPYFRHAVAVAELAGKRAGLAYETGLCHDLLEDGLTTKEKLHAVLAGLSYDADAIRTIIRAVVELSDVYTKEAYPKLRKKQRKELEEKRLTTTGGLAQTVKYADLDDNIRWVSRYRPEKLKKYLRRKINLLEKLTKGETGLRLRVLDAARLALAQANN
ncbi:MAG: hypothetical protein JKY70_17550 [Mucilaginibacter sp.]|nr:hypothetical protein [Mucilaginibacter sp.]